MCYFFLRMINGVLVLVCDTFSLTPWILSRRVDHHIMGFFYFPTFSIGVSNSFGLFCVFRLAQTPTPTYIHLHTIYRPREGFRQRRIGAAARGSLRIIIIPFGFYLASFDIWNNLSALSKHPKYPHDRLKKKEGRAWPSPCLNPHTSHSTPYYIISFVKMVFFFFLFFFSIFYTKEGRRREEEEWEEERKTED